MKNIVIVLSIILASVTLNKAQNNITVQDTIDVVTSEAFKIPNDKNIVFANLLRFEAKAYILDANLNELREATDYFRNPDQKSMEKEVKGGRGTNVQFHVKDKIDQVGEFYVRIDVKIMSENKKVLKKSAYYLVRVSNPHIASIINLAESYYYSEKESFSFATQEYLDLNLYSFNVMDQNENIVFEGSGPIVELDTLLNNIKMVGANITINGYYDGKMFEYFENGNPTPKSSKWTVNIEQPTINKFTDWKESQDDNTGDIFISVYNKNAMKILYTYIGTKKDKSGLVVVKPQFNGFNVLNMKPEGLIKRANFSTRASGPWMMVYFTLDQDYLDALGNEYYDGIECEFSIVFTTQFGEKIVHKYSATLYK